ncbi:unnamed protein product, partial [Ectocarpus fasciculatus]
MAARALKVAVLATTAVLLMKGADMPQHRQQFQDMRQDFRNPAICSGVNPLLQRFGDKVAPAVLMTGSIPVSASATTAGSSISSSAQSTSAEGVGLGSACGSEDAECHGDDTDEMTLSMLCWICTFFIWYLVARTTIAATMYVAGSATALFVAIG